MKRVMWLQEKLQPAEWAAAVLAGLGTVGLGASSAEDSAAGEAAHISVRGLALIVLLLLLALGCSSLLRMRRRQRRAGSAGKAGAAGAYLLGLQAGACFGLSAAACRTGARAHSKHFSKPMWDMKCSFTNRYD